MGLMLKLKKKGISLLLQQINKNVMIPISFNDIKFFKTDRISKVIIESKEDNFDGSG